MVSEKAAEAARKGADAAEKAVRQAEIANAVSQRAYLYLSGVRLRRYPANKIEITYPICNAGQTPGRFTGEFSRANVYSVGVLPEPFKRGEIALTEKSVVVPPTRTDSAQLNGKYYIDLSDDEVEAINAERSQLVFHGFIRYFDISGRWHDTGFGVAYSGALMPNECYYMGWIQREGFNWFD
jgi:hypothetical protein